MIQSIRHADNVKILCKIPQQIRSTVIHRMYRCAVSQMESHTILCSVIINYNRRNDWFYYSWRFNQIQWISNWPLIISIYGSTADKVFPREIKGLIKGRIKGCPSSRGISLPGRWHRASTSNSVNFQFQFAKKQKCPCQIFIQNLEVLLLGKVWRIFTVYWGRKIRMTVSAGI